MTPWPFPIVLASASPRRAELLSTIVSDFLVDPAELDEGAYVQPDPWATAENLALAKAVLVHQHHPDSVVIGGDTVVAVPKNGETYVQLGKPASVAEAREMLSTLSGQTHVVITGVGLATPYGREGFCVATDVRFRPLSAKEISDYVATGEPMDKAGAYAVQGGASRFVEDVSGSWTNVVGLPMEELQLRLERIRQMVVP